VIGSHALYSDEELLPLSALQHLVFCERQAALIHVERLWEDNTLTLEGSHLHRRVDETGERRERRGDLVILRGLGLKSLRLGIVGRADVVELHRVGSMQDGDVGNGGGGAPIVGLPGRWKPFPVDYKRGKPKPDRCDEVQLCAQGLCLEEMYCIDITEGALFYGRDKRRQTVAFDPELRRLTSDAAARLHQMVRARETPTARKQKKCRQCSLADLCLPQAMTRRSASTYLRRLTAAASDEDGGPT
jgi:CRISPR-associated exonuclease Cas4